MRSCRAIAFVAVAAAVFMVGANATAVDYTLNVPAGGAVAWQNNASWTPNSAFPNANTDTANLSIGLTSNLALDVGATNVTVSRLTMGGTAGAVTSDVVSTGGKLSMDIDPDGNTVIVSGGVSGSTNRITAPVVLNDTLDIDATSTNDLTFAGAISMSGANRTLSNNMTGGKKLVLNVVNLTDEDGATARTITFAAAANSNARTELNGTFDRGPGNGNYAFSTNADQRFATFAFNAAQTYSAGANALQRSNYAINNNLAFGPGTITDAGAGTLTVANSITTTNGNNATWSGTIYTELPGGVTIPNLIIMGNSAAFAGSNNITISGALTQGNNRAMGNMIASGASLSLTPDTTPVTGTNPTGISIGISRLVGDGNRTWIFEGAGTTIVNGLIVNNLTDDSVAANVNGNVEKRGSGRTVLNNPLNTMRGQIRARGGILVFGAAGSWGDITAATHEIQIQTNGGFWYTPGVADPGWNTLIQQITTNTGFIALPASASGQSFDFSTGDLALTGANLGIGADGNVTYTGTVTPNPTAGYNWGGNSGTLTLGANSSVGANNVTYKNGGTVVLTGSQSYSGITTLAGDNMVTSQSGILPKNLNSTSAFNVFTPTVLSVNQVSNGGGNSTLGASTSDAANLVFNGGTLRYTGGAGSTDRLFTIGTGGATLDSSGTGALAFNNTGALAVTGTSLILTGTNTGNNTVAPSLTGTIGVTKRGAGKWVLTNASNAYVGVTRIENGSLSLTSPFLDDTSDVQIFGGALDLSFPVGTPDTIDEFFIGGAPQAAGTWGAIGNGSATFQTPFITGTGILNVTTFNISTLAGDYNQNGVVDSADYVLWRENLDQPVVLPNSDPADVDGMVTDAEYNYWRARFGNSVVTGASLGGNMAVPEPTAVLLAAVACGLALARSGRSRRK